MIAITSSGQNLKSNVSVRFGRSQHFLILDEDGNLEEVVSNPGVGTQRGAGVQAAQTIADQGVEVLITGNIGPNAFSALQTAGVEVFLASGIKAKDAFEKWNNDELNKAEAPTGGAGAGSGRGRGFGNNSGQGPGRGKGQGKNQGQERGKGQGRGPQRN